MFRSHPGGGEEGEETRDALAGIGGMAKGAGRTGTEQFPRFRSSGRELGVGVPGHPFQQDDGRVVAYTSLLVVHDRPVEAA
jgi:hypothetical protein